MKEEIIDKISKAKKLEDVIDTSKFKDEFNSLMKEIHPDVCNLPGANEAVQTLNSWKDYFENGKRYKDDAGVFKTNGYWADFLDPSKNLNWSVENYRLFTQLQDQASKHFVKYLPKECKLLQDGSYRFIFDKRSIPLSGLELPQEHVNWVLNRLLEYSSYLAETGFSHMGLNPESVFIVPETHGIQVCSFYHLTRLDRKVGTISAKYKNWYPSGLFSYKMATSDVDVNMSKRIAAYLLGDKSGAGTKFRKTHNEDFVNFILTHHNTPYTALMAYKELLAKNFKKEFHNLTI